MPVPNTFKFTQQPSEDQANSDIYYRNEAEENFNFPSNSECELCQDESGELASCETCPRSFHLACLRRKLKANEDFYCNICDESQHVINCKQCRRKILTVDEQLEVETGDSRNLASPAKVGTELLLARCSLCYDYMHVKCVQTPLWLILSGGFYMKNGYDFERAKRIASQILPLLSGATTLQ